MANLPRIAIGTVQTAADATPITWALLEVLARRGLRLQSFLAQACFCPRDGATAITGEPARHLDSWLMPPELCRQVFARGCRQCDLAVVEGRYSADSEDPVRPAARLETLCQWLDMPALAVVDARLLESCRLPPRPTGLDGVLLDCLRDVAEYVPLQTHFEAVWNVPVLGWLPRLESLRTEITAIDCGGQPNSDLCGQLGDALQANLQVERLLRIARSQSWPAAGAASGEPPCASAAVRIAIAYDDAFHGYFPDALDLLEQRGAELVDFSPLHDEQLPPHTDVVYIGCGHPERFARPLAENDCLILSLKSHVSCGRRIYAECGGLAYLCQHIELADGERWPMAGVLPATAHLDSCSPHPCPAELELTGTTWVGEAGQTLRGYLNPRWSLTAAPQLAGCAAAGHQFDLSACHHAVGSRMYVHLAAHQPMLSRFTAPQLASPSVPPA